MSTGAYIANVAAIICFSVLAIVFQHWWIVLFSAFFLNSPIRKEDERHDT